MDYVVVGGDERFAVLARLLAGRGNEVGVLGREAPPGLEGVGLDALARARNIVVNCPPKLRRLELGLGDVRRAASGHARLYLCGPGHPERIEDNEADLWADEALQRENARLTAEGAVSAAMRASDRALGDMACMIVGWGRIGRALTELLVGIGARVTVVSRSAANRNRAVERGAEAVATNQVAECLPGVRLVFNTAPAMVLDGTALRRADRNVMLIDLASPPYGIDLRAAWGLGLRAWREPGLPGRYCPESAARALLAAMGRWDARRRNGDD